MGREVPGSEFERGDDERRTWDEMGWWDQPFSADEDDYSTDDDTIEDDDPTTLDDWLSGWAEPGSNTVERVFLAELDTRIHDLAERLHYRDVAARAGEEVDRATAESEKALHDRLVKFRRQHPDPAEVSAPDAPGRPSEIEPAPGRPRHRHSPARQVQRAITERLTVGELLHWQELQKGTTQSGIAEKLGISQGAVSKRERALRDRINAISLETIGRPYPARLIDRGMWARQGRRRNKSGSGKQ